MSDAILRPWQEDDRDGLRALWKTAFGDPDEYIDSFFESFLAPGACIVADIGGRVVSAMYIIREQTLYPRRKKTLSSGYTYALATLPEYRGRGIGAAVYKAASDAVLKTADIACVLPAEESLYPFYEKASGARVVSYAREARIPRSELSGAAPCMAARLPMLEYTLMREELLGGYPHAELGDELFAHLERTGTEFFVLAQGLAAVENDGGVCRITELLDPGDDWLTSVAGVARWCPAEEYVVRTPLFFEGPGKERPFMLAAFGSEPDYRLSDELWWGVGLD